MKKIIYALLFFTAPLLCEDFDPLLNSAYKAYQKGEQSQMPLQKEKAFNKALSLYTLLESKTAPNGKLYFNIANCYYHLGEEGMATLYYEKALKLMPREPRIKMQLSRIRAPQGSWTLASLFFFWHETLLFQEKMLLLSLLFFLSALFWSLFLLKPTRFLKGVSVAHSFLFLTLFGSMVYASYFEPKWAVLIKPTALHCDSGDHYDKVLKSPANPGQKVKVLHITEDGHWLKVKMESGQEGFASYKEVRLL